LTVPQVMTQQRLGVDKVMGEGGLYAPEYAAIALKQTEGDVFEAAFMLRAFITTMERRYYSETLDTREMFVRRKISASFREIPGGQVLGPTRDYSQRLLDTRMVHETEKDIQAFLDSFAAKVDKTKLQEVRTARKVIDLLREEGLLQPVGNAEDRTLKDITREAVSFPAPRSARLQMLSRAETGGLMALGYASMRGFGATHPTVGELRYGTVPLRVKDPSGRVRHIGELPVTEAEMVSTIKIAKKKQAPYFAIGYGLCLGQNDTKAICMGILDRAMRSPDTGSPPNDAEFVLYHTEGIESMGFTNHLKLPHYVTFQAGLSNLRQAIERANAPAVAPANPQPALP
jgi:alpha-D-ribose 1-methylphosphonate 5-triphosphate synthase subunit PhnI